MAFLTLKCDTCKFKGRARDFPTVDGAWTCPRCLMDESGIIVRLRVPQWFARMWRNKRGQKP